MICANTIAQIIIKFFKGIDLFIQDMMRLFLYQQNTVKLLKVLVFLEV